VGNGKEKLMKSYGIEGKVSDSSNHPEYHREKQRIQKFKNKAPKAKGNPIYVNCMVSDKTYCNEGKIKHHPQANKESVPWAESKMGKLFKRHKVDVLPFEKYISDGKLIP